MQIAAIHRPRYQGLFPLEDYEREACDFLAQHEPPEGYYVGFSGGKDSIVTLALCKMAGVKHTAYYSCTRIDPPEVVRFIRQNYPEVVWLYPAETFWSAIRKNSPPIRMQRWCCDVLKKNPGKKIPLPHRVMGLRAEESFSRSQRPRVSKMGKQMHYKPIFHWMEWQVWEFIQTHGLEYPSLYDEGWDRIGCVICPFLYHKNQKALIRNKTRWPGMYRSFEAACKSWFDARMNDGKKRNQVNDTFPEYMAAYYRGFE